MRLMGEGRSVRRARQTLEDFFSIFDVFWHGLVPALVATTRLVATAATYPLGDLIRSEMPAPPIARGVVGAAGGAEPLATH